MCERALPATGSSAAKFVDTICQTTIRTNSLVLTRCVGVCLLPATALCLAPCLQALCEQNEAQAALALQALSAVAERS